MRQKQPAIIEHLAFLSVVHSVPLADLFTALGVARENRKSHCQSIAIEYRGTIKKQAIFLLTKKSAVIGQFRVDEDFLKSRNLCFENWLENDKVRRQLFRQKTDSLHTLVQDLRHGMKKVNVDAEVFETTVPSRVQTQYGNTATVTNAMIGDDTGRIRLCLWNERANIVSKGDTIRIKNASVSSYKGERLLCIGRTGTVSILTHAK